jgi:hypothetical protein
MAHPDEGAEATADEPPLPLLASPGCATSVQLSELGIDAEAYEQLFGYPPERPLAGFDGPLFD